jgi:hypothetical protein
VQNDGATACLVGMSVYVDIADGSVSFDEFGVADCEFTASLAPIDADTSTLTVTTIDYGELQSLRAENPRARSRRPSGPPWCKG